MTKSRGLPISGLGSVLAFQVYTFSLNQLRTKISLSDFGDSNLMMSCHYSSFCVCTFDVSMLCRSIVFADYLPTFALISPMMILATLLGLLFRSTEDVFLLHFSQLLEHRTKLMLC